MIVERPSIRDERSLRLTDEALNWRRERLIDASELQRIRALPQSWRRSSLRLVLFFLTAAGMVALNHFFDVIGLPEGLFVALIGLGSAEFLIRTKKFHHSGAEEALFLGGLLSPIFALPGPSRPEALLLFAAAFLFAGWRLLNELFLVSGALFVAGYLAARLSNPLLPFVACIGAAIVAAILIARPMRRPWVDRTLALIVVLMPIAALTIVRAAERKPDLDPSMSFLACVSLLAVLSIALLTHGVRSRIRFQLIGGLVTAAAVAVQVSFFSDWPAEVLFLVWGGIVLLGAMGVHRLLRGRDRGVTVHAAGDSEAVSMVVAPIVAPYEPAGTVPGREGGGSFGGAGASGDYEAR